MHFKIVQGTRSDPAARRAAIAVLARLTLEIITERRAAEAQRSTPSAEPSPVDPCPHPTNDPEVGA